MERKSPFELVKSDPLFLEAQSWGCYPGFLVNEIERLGAVQVRRSIAYVSALGEARLNRRQDTENEPLDVKRFKYLRTCLLNGGVYEYKREYQAARDKGYLE